jgi:hypothetical protein
MTDDNPVVPLPTARSAHRSTAPQATTLDKSFSSHIRSTFRWFERQFCLDDICSTVRPVQTRHLVVLRHSLLNLKCTSLQATFIIKADCANFLQISEI